MEILQREELEDKRLLAVMETTSPDTLEKLHQQVAALEMRQKTLKDPIEKENDRPTVSLNAIMSQHLNGVKPPPQQEKKSPPSPPTAAEDLSQQEEDDEVYDGSEIDEEEELEDELEEERAKKEVADFIESSSEEEEDDKKPPPVVVKNGGGGGGAEHILLKKQRENSENFTKEFSLFVQNELLTLIGGEPYVNGLKRLPEQKQKEIKNAPHVSIRLLVLEVMRIVADYLNSDASHLRKDTQKQLNMCLINLSQTMRIHTTELKTDQTLTAPDASIEGGKISATSFYKMELFNKMDAKIITLYENKTWYDFITNFAALRRMRVMCCEIIKKRFENRRALPAYGEAKSMMDKFVFVSEQKTLMADLLASITSIVQYFHMTFVKNEKWRQKFFDSKIPANLFLKGVAVHQSKLSFVANTAHKKGTKAQIETKKRLLVHQFNDDKYESAPPPPEKKQKVEQENKKAPHPHQKMIVNLLDDDD